MRRDAHQYPRRPNPKEIQQLSYHWSWAGNKPEELDHAITDLCRVAVFDCDEARPDRAPKVAVATSDFDPDNYWLYLWKENGEVELREQSEREREDRRKYKEWLDAGAPRLTGDRTSPEEPPRGHRCKP